MPNHAGAAGLRQPGGLFRGPPAYAAHTPWRPVQALAAVIVILLLSAAVPWLLIDFAGTMLGRPVVTGQGADIASRVLVVVLTLVASMLLGGRIRDVLALRSPARGWRSYIGAALLSIIGPFLFAVVLILVIVLLGQVDWLIQLVQDDSRSMHAAPADWPLAVIIAPLEEELVFRGFLLSALAKSRVGFWGAAVVSTALWTALHEYSVLGIAKVFTVGLLFSWLLWRTGSLRVTIFCHALNNAVALSVLQSLDVTG